MIEITVISIFLGGYLLLPYLLPKSLTPMKRDELTQWYLFCTAIIAVTGSNNLFVRGVMLVAALLAGLRTFWAISRERQLLFADTLSVQVEGNPVQNLNLSRLVDSYNTAKGLASVGASKFYWRKCMGPQVFTIYYYRGANLIAKLPVHTLKLDALQKGKDRGHLSAMAFPVGDNLCVAILGTRVYPLKSSLAGAVENRVLHPVAPQETPAEEP